jgi:hypothetical protein
MTEPREHETDESRRREAEHERGTMDPGLKEQFERDRTVVHNRPSATPEADALQRPHYEPEAES